MSNPNENAQSYQQWVEEVYTPWFEAFNEVDSGGNSPPPPPPTFEGEG